MGIASAIILGLLGAGGAALSYFGAKKQAKTNQEIAAQNMQLQQQENEIAREREDNAVARRAADLEATGLSKTLAAGSAASSQLMTAPKNDYFAENFGAAALSGISQGAQVAQQVANVQNTVAQTQAQKLANDTYMEKHFADIDVKKANSRQLEAYAKLKEIEGSFKVEELQLKIDNMIESVLKSQSDRMINDSVIELNAQKIIESKSLVGLRSKESSNLAYTIALNKLKIKAEEHNLEVARRFGLPVGSQPNGLLGSGVSAGVALKNLWRTKNSTASNLGGGFGW